MSDEDTFEKYLKLANKFTFIDTCFKVLNWKENGSIIEIDNLGIKNKILYIFEGKKGKIDIHQLKERFILFQNNRTWILSKEIVPFYGFVKVFHYNLKRQKIIEVNIKGDILETYAYKTIPEFIRILQKI